MPTDRDLRSHGLAEIVHSTEYPITNPGTVTPTHFASLGRILIMPPEPSQTSASNASLEDVTVQTSGEQGWSLLKLLGIARRKVLIIIAMGVVMGVLMTLKNARKVPEYQSNFRLLVEPVRDQRELAQLTDTQSGGTQKELDYATQIEVLLSPEVLEPILTDVNERYPNTDYGSVIGKLGVIRLGETKILEVSYSDKNPEKVKFLLDIISQGYLEYSLNSQRAQLLQGLAFVDDRLKLVQSNVKNLENQLQTLQQTYQFMEPTGFSDSLFGQLNSITQARQDLQAELVTRQTEYNALLEQAGATAALREAQNYQTMLDQYQSLQQQIAIESARFGPQSPTIQLLERQQANLAPLLQREAERVLQDELTTRYNEIQALSARDRELGTAEDRVRRTIQQLPAISRTYNELQRELVMANSSLTRFLETKETLQIQASQNEIPWELITPTEPVRQKATTSTSKTLIMGFIMGAGLGFGIAFFLERLENTYYSVVEVKKGVPLPILGLIPLHPDLVDGDTTAHVVDLRSQTEAPRSLTEDMGSLKAQFKNMMGQSRKSTENGNSGKNGHTATPSHSSENGHRSTGDRWLWEYDSYGFLEAFRALHANIIPLPVKSIVLTSALPNEGATTVAVHLVQAASAMGRRVLLVDAQFRRGGRTLDTLLNIRQDIGLSDFIQGNASLNQIIQRLSWESNLYAISCGSNLTDPTRLLSSQRLQELVERLDKVFDLVVYTMPPLMGLADVSLVAAQTDGVLLVTSLGRRQSASGLSQTLDRLRIAQIPVLGLVVNRVRNYSVDLYARV